MIHHSKKKDWEAIQQPLAKDGYSNPEFDRLYSHKTKNPFKGTERDRTKRRSYQRGFGKGTNICNVCGNKYEYNLKTKMFLKGGRATISCNHDNKGFAYDILEETYFKK